MNDTISNDSIKFDPSSDFVIYLYVRIIIVTITTLIWITSFVALVVLSFYLRTVSSTTVVYIRLIIISSLFGVIVGLSMTIVVYSTDFHIYSFGFCIGFHMTSLTVHLWTNVTNLILLAGMSVERYFVITSKMVSPKKYKSKNKRQLVFIILLLVCGFVLSCALCIILYRNRKANYRRTECAMAFGHGMKKCSSLVKKCSTFMITIILSIAMSGCSAILFLTTFQLRKRVRDNDKRLSIHLQRFRMTNTKRIQATHLLWFVFTFEWLPYGISRMLLYANFSMNTFFSLSAIFNTISTLSFLSLPIVYYKMDIEYSKYVRGLLCKKNISNKIRPSNVEETN